MEWPTQTKSKLSLSVWHGVPKLELDIGDMARFICSSLLWLLMFLAGIGSIKRY